MANVITRYANGDLEITNEKHQRWRLDADSHWWYWIGGKGDGHWDRIQSPPNYIADIVFNWREEKGKKNKKKDKGFWKKTFGLGNDPATEFPTAVPTPPPLYFEGFHKNKGYCDREQRKIRDGVGDGVSDWRGATASGPPKPVVFCHHWRQPFKVGEHEVFVSARRSCPTKLDDVPYAGLYLDPSWRSVVNSTGLGTGTNVPDLGGRYEAIFLDWPDRGVVKDLGVLEASLRWLMSFAKVGKMADIGCIGSHGRTGTALACLLVMEEGLTADEAIVAVRDRHCKRCIESAAQEHMIGEFFEYLHKQGEGV